jgi:predicted nucleotidyltransferase
MPRVDPHLIPLLIDLERGLREMAIPFAIVGALVPELLLDASPARMTNDTDAVVIVESLDVFDALQGRLAAYGFEPTRMRHRMRHRDGGLVDLLPYSESIAPGGRLQFDEGRVFNMAGFGQVVPQAVSTAIEGGPTVPIAPLPLYALLKLVAFSDRQQPKDLAGILHCLKHFLEDDERRYGADHEGQGVPFEFTCAYLLGVDARRYLDEPLARTAAGVLHGFRDTDAAYVTITAMEAGRLPVQDSDRVEVFQCFRWFRLGAGL